MAAIIQLCRLDRGSEFSLAMAPFYSAKACWPDPQLPRSTAGLGLLVAKACCK